MLVNILNFSGLRVLVFKESSCRAYSQGSTPGLNIIQTQAFFPVQICAARCSQTVA